MSPDWLSRLLGLLALGVGAAWWLQGEHPMAGRALLGLLGALLTLQASAALGAGALRRQQGLEALALGGVALGTGMGALSLLLSPSLAAGLLLGLSTLAWRWAPPLRWPPISAGWGLAAGALVLLSLPEILAPPLQTDAMSYHLALPAMLLREGSLPGGLLLPDASRPLPLQMLWAVAMVPGGEVAPKALHTVWGLALLAALLDWSRGLLGEQAARVTLLLLVGCASFLHPWASGQAELPLALVMLLGLRAAWEGRLGSLTLLGGAAFAIKYTSAPGILALWTLWAARHRPSPKSLLTQLAWAALGLLWVLPWWVHNLAQDLHPLFPFTGWPVEDLRFMALERYGHGGSWGELLLLPWRLVTEAELNQYPFQGKLHVALLMALAGLPRARAVWPIALAAVLATAGWLAGPRSLRLLLPVLPWWALLAGASWAQLPSWARGGTLLVWLLGLGGQTQPWLLGLAERAPASWSPQARERLLEQQIRDWEGVRWLNEHTAPGDKVALLYSWPRYYLERPQLLGSVEDHTPARVLWFMEGQDSMSRLREEGVDYVLFWSRPLLRRSYPFLSDEEFEEQYQEPVDSLYQSLLLESELVFQRGRLSVWWLGSSP